MQISYDINRIFSADMAFGRDDTCSNSPSPPSVLRSQMEAQTNTFMLWAKHMQDANKIDAVSLMPPPATTLPLNIRRTSFSSGLLPCGSVDQSSPPILKSEILDENSQNSILSTGADTINHDSMDTFGNENSMDASNSAPLIQQTPLEMIMQKNVDLTNPFAPALNQTAMMNITSTSPTINVVDLRVKQEDDLSVQMQDMVNPVVLNENSNSNFLSSFAAPKMSDLKVQVNDLPMFGASPSALSNSPEVLLRNSLNAMKAGVPLVSDQQLQQAADQQTSVFSTPIMTEAGTAAGLNQMLSFPNATQAISPNMLATSPTNPSPLSADVMLNSQSINPLNTSPTMLAVKSAGPSTIVSNLQTESDIIMNPTISPTMMCTNTAAETPLIAGNVAIADAPMLTAPNQQSDSLLMNNLMQPMSIKQSDAAVKNMILNAAAEILSSEPNSITAETTTNALMSLNTESNVQQNVQHVNSPPSITNILTHTDSTSSVVVLAGNNKLIQNVVEAAMVQNADIIQNHVVSADNVQMGNFVPSSQVVNVQPSTTSALSANLSPVQQSLLNNIQ